MNISMNKETLKAMAKEFAKDIKTQDDLNLYQRAGQAYYGGGP